MAEKSKRDQGWKDGRQGKSAASTDPEYMEGYLQGVSALEEAENGHKSWGC